MTSSLQSNADKFAYQLRPTSTQDNWGGDEAVTLSVIDLDIALRLEWQETVEPRWDLWVFEDVDIQQEDIFLIEISNLALTVARVMRFTDFDGDFHHLEVTTSEHEQDIATLKTAAGI